MSERNVEELLPWYINGSLDDEEIKLVEQELASSESLREQLAFLKLVSAAEKSQTVSEASELGWRRLQRDIREHDHASNSVMRGDDVSASERNADNASKRDWFRPSIAVAAMLVIALQLGILNQQDSSSDIELLGVSSALLKEPHWIVQIEFSEQASWQHMHSLMNQVNAQIVDGPSSLGIVSIAVPESSDQFEDDQALLDWLKAQDVVSHAVLQTQ